MNLGDIQLPEKFLDRLFYIVPSEQLTEVLESYIEPRVTSFRVNTALATTEEIIAGLNDLGIEWHQLSWFDKAFWIKAEDRMTLLTSPLMAEFKIYVQNLSSMIPPLVLDPQPGETILDVAAAPGSKTLQMANLMNNEGQILATDVDRNRLYKLQRNAGFHKADVVMPKHADGEVLWKRYMEHFDKVLLDTPCSTEGRFRSGEPDTYRHWNIKKVRNVSQVQFRLIFSAIQCLKPGGTLVYSTCSMSPEENEATIDKAIKKFGDAIEVIPTGFNFPDFSPPMKSWNERFFNDAVSESRRILPNPLMEAFFVCKIKKLESTAHMRLPRR